MRKRSYLDGGDAIRRPLSVVLAVLRAQSISYQTSHWQTSGPNFYAQHLLFERLYGSVQDEIDVIGEKGVGYFGTSTVDLAPSIASVASVATHLASVPDHVERGLASENLLQKVLVALRAKAEAVGALTPGLDDWIAATASAHETNIYLLQQVSGTARVASRRRRANEGPAAHHFYDTPRKRETREFAESDAQSNLPGIRHPSDAPPTPMEISDDHPGAKGLSTLSRQVLKSEDPATAPAAKANRALMASWLREIR